MCILALGPAGCARFGASSGAWAAVTLAGGLQPMVSYTLSVLVSGLGVQSVVLRNNGGETLTVSANGTATFAQTYAPGATYSIQIDQAPGDRQCVLGAQTGVFGNSDVSGVTLNCARYGFTLGGTVSGLSGSGLTLQNNNADDLVIAANGAFEFNSGVANGVSYEVRVKTQPSSPTQSCALDAAAGVVSGANVRTVRVTCVNGLLGAGSILQPPVISGSPQLTTLAGSGAAIHTDGTGTAAAFNQPSRGATDGTFLYVTEQGAASIRRVRLATGEVTTLVTSPANPFVEPAGITTDGTYLYVSDSTTNRVYRMVLATGVVTLLAGGNSGGGVTCPGTQAANCKNGTGSAAEFGLLRGLTTDGTNVYVADHGSNRIRSIAIATGVVSTLAGDGSSAILNTPAELVALGGFVYVADESNNRVVRIRTSDGDRTTLFTLASVRAITTDGSNLYVATNFHAVYSYNSLLPAGTLTLIAGESGTPAFADGPAVATGRLNSPKSIINDGDALYIVDFSNHRIRKYK